MGHGNLRALLMGGALLLGLTLLSLVFRTAVAAHPPALAEPPGAEAIAQGLDLRIAAAAPLTTPTPIRTVTPTPPCCTSMSGAVLTPTCNYDTGTGQFSFGFYDEIYNMCGVSIPATLVDTLQVSTDGVNWTPQAQSGPVQVTLPPAPPPYARFGSFSNQVIPGQYTYFRVVAAVQQNISCATYLFYSPPQSLCRPPVTPSATPTGTLVAPSPSPTPTVFVICDIFNGGATTDCVPPSTYEYDFTFLVYCNMTLTGSGILYFDVAPASGGPWTLYDQQSWSHSFPPGSPGVTHVTGSFTETNIPGQYSFYRVRLVGSGSNGQPLSNMTGSAALCGISSTVTPDTSRTPTATPTVCTLAFTDVLASDPFYAFVRCLACRGVVNGYQCGGPGEPCDPPQNPYFRPAAGITRGQLAKILAVAAGLNAPVPSTQQTFADVPPGNPFWLWIERLAGSGAISGYGCGGSGEPCDPQARSYFRWGASATRGQIAKIAAQAAGIPDPIPAARQTFTDVPSGNPFWLWIERLAGRGVISGYACGGLGESCDPQARPYFRWGAATTRGQMAKIAANTFFHGCSTPQRGTMGTER